MIRRERSTPRPGVGRLIGQPSFGTGPRLAPGDFAASMPSASSLTNCSRVTTLDCLRQLYNVGDFNQTQTQKNSLGIGTPRELDVRMLNLSSLPTVEYTPQVGSRDTSHYQT